MPLGPEKAGTVPVTTICVRTFACACRYYTEAYTSENMMVRIYKVNRVSLKSKKHCKENPGEYPPALEPVLATRQSFEQIHGLSLDDASEAWELAGEVLENFLGNVGVKAKKAAKWRKWLEQTLRQVSEAATAAGIA
jgi:hypothetical protein